MKKHTALEICTEGALRFSLLGSSFAETAKKIGRLAMSISPCPEMKALADELAAALKQREDLSADNDPVEMQANVEKVNELIAVHRAECSVCSRVFPQTVSDGPAIISNET